MPSVNENPVYSGLVKINTLSANTLNGKPSGWFVREKYDKETGKSIVLEFGIHLSEDIFLSVPVHFSMKNLFVRANIEDPDYNYYQVPNNVEFGVATYTNKKTGNISPMLVSPNEKHPPVFVAAYAYSPKTIILGMEFTSPDTFVLKRYFDKDRTLLGFIAFTPVSETTKITCTIKEGILNTTTQTIQNIEFNVNGCTTEQDTVTTEEKNSTEFIKMPMYIILPPKNNNKPQDTDTPENDEKPVKKKHWENKKTDDAADGNEDTEKKPFKPYKPYHQRRVYNDYPVDEGREYKRNKYNRKKGNNKNYRRDKSDEE